jgi:hypothetical protein
MEQKSDGTIADKTYKIYMKFYLGNRYQNKATTSVP